MWVGEFAEETFNLVFKNWWTSFNYVLDVFNITYCTSTGVKDTTDTIEDAIFLWDS